MHFYSMNIPGIESYEPSKPYAEVLEDFKGIEEEAWMQFGLHTTYGLEKL